MENAGPRPRPPKKLRRGQQIASWLPRRLSGPHRSAVWVANICFGGVLGPSWWPLGPSWEPLGSLLGGLEGLLGCLWGLLGRLGSLLGCRWPPWSRSGASWGHLGPIFVHLYVGASSTSQEPPEGGWRQGRLRHQIFDPKLQSGFQDSRGSYP